MNRTAKKIADNISAQMNYTEEKSAVIAYGMLAIMQMAIILLFAIVFGILTGTLAQSLLIYLVVGSLRKYTGGAHASSMGVCIAVSFAVITAGALLSVYALSSLIYAAAYIILPLSAGIWFFTAYKYVPVDSPNKKITNPEKIKRLRQRSFIFIGLIFAVLAVFLVVSKLTKNEFLYTLHWAVYIAAFWQIWTLTITGRKLLSRLDKALNFLSGNSKV